MTLRSPTEHTPEHMDINSDEEFIDGEAPPDNPVEVEAPPDKPVEVQEVKVVVEGKEVGEANGVSCVRKVALGSEYHGTVSQARHTPHSAILEILENAIGRGASIVHFCLRQFGTATPFFVSVSSISISHEDFKVCLDQRPRKRDELTHQLSVFGDGMKSGSNCLTNGQGNLYVLVKRGEEYWIARYGKPLDEYLHATDCTVLHTCWDVVQGCAVDEEGEPLTSKVQR